MLRSRYLTLIFLPILLLLVITNSYLSSSPRVIVTTPSLFLHRKLITRSHPLAVTESSPLISPPVTESILLPDWDVFVLLPSGIPTTGNLTAVSCLFSNGDTSPATYTKKIPSSARLGFLCKMPRGVQRLRTFYSPSLIGSGSDDVLIGSGRNSEMIRWNRLAYESLSTADDVIVFAKGVNKIQGRNRPDTDVSCIYSVNGAVKSVTAVASSAQEVFRCHHPEIKLNSRDDEDVRVTIQIAGEKTPLSSVAVYRPPSPAHDRDTTKKKLTCACNMVYNSAKFLREWVAYHDAIGVEKFTIYDNGSDDDLDSVLTQLNADGYDVSSIYWPWQKTQEAGFSHCAAAHVSTCTWMAFIDVDEFIYSPSWAGASKPNKTMIERSVIGSGSDSAGAGQVQIMCNDFGPSGMRSHPRAGVTQGYTCRARADDDRLRRHKSLVRLDTVGPALKNSVHHFEVGPAWVSKRVNKVVVIHYKYQAWSEFRLKFRRRVSAYVADWREKRNVGSRDRVPGLGFDDVEPRGWSSKKCKERDEGLKDLVRTWFLRGDGRFDWE